MDMPFEILKIQAVVAHPAAYEVSSINKECADLISLSSKIHMSLLAAYLKTENSTSGSILVNDNGSYDIGPMQVNTINWKKLHDKYQITPLQLRFDGCINLLAGAHLIRNRFDRHSREDISTWDIFYRVAAEYHSYTAEHNRNYQGKWVANLNSVLENGYEFE